MLIHTRAKRQARFPWMCSAIAAACVGVALWKATLLEPARATLTNQWGTVPSVLFGADLTPGVDYQTWLTLLTASFVHADWLHLVGNLAYLLLFGIAVERALGWWRFGLLYFLCGALANLVAAWQLGQTSTAPLIGASGAVSAVIGAYLTLFPSAAMVILLPLGLFIQFVRVSVWLVIGSWFTLQLLYTWFGPAFGMVAWWAHVVGFLSGLILAVAAGLGSGERRIRQVTGYR